jgi:hypothetical protein
MPGFRLCALKPGQGRNHRLLRASFDVENLGSQRRSPWHSHRQRTMRCMMGRCPNRHAESEILTCCHHRRTGLKREWQGKVELVTAPRTSAEASTVERHFDPPSARPMESVRGSGSVVNNRRIGIWLQLTKSWRILYRLFSEGRARYTSHLLAGHAGRNAASMRNSGRPIACQEARRGAHIFKTPSLAYCLPCWSGGITAWECKCPTSQTPAEELQWVRRRSTIARREPTQI